MEGRDLSSTKHVLALEDDSRLHPLIRSILSEEEVTVQFCTQIETARAMLRAQRFDALLVDLGLPDGSGITFIEELHRQQPEVPCLVLTGAVARDTVMSALRAGACGYLLKEDLIERLPFALHSVLEGGMPMSVAAAGYLLEHLRRGAPISPLSAPPTERERELLALLARGLTYEQSASALGVSVNTVRSHIRAIYDKLQAANKAEAVMLALQEGWI
jgi:DNA-binding NarL/FixJ family response regulator